MLNVFHRWLEKLITTLRVVFIVNMTLKYSTHPSVPSAVGFVLKDEISSERVLIIKVDV